MEVFDFPTRLLFSRKERVTTTKWETGISFEAPPEKLVRAPAPGEEGRVTGSVVENPGETSTVNQIDFDYEPLFCLDGDSVLVKDQRKFLLIFDLRTRKMRELVNEPVEEVDWFPKSPPLTARTSTVHDERDLYTWGQYRKVESLVVFTKARELKLVNLRGETLKVIPAHQIYTSDEAEDLDVPEIHDLLTLTDERLIFKEAYSGVGYLYSFREDSFTELRERIHFSLLPDGNFAEIDFSHVSLWDPVEKKEVEEALVTGLSHNESTVLFFTHRGRQKVAYASSVEEGKNVYVKDFTGEESVELKTETGVIPLAYWGGKLVAGEFEGDVLVWDLDTGQLERKIKNRDTTFLEFLRDGRLLVNNRKLFDLGKENGGKEIGGGFIEEVPISLSKVKRMRKFLRDSTPLAYELVDVLMRFFGDFSPGMV